MAGNISAADIATCNLSRNEPPSIYVCRNTFNSKKYSGTLTYYYKKGLKNKQMNTLT